MTKLPDPFADGAPPHIVAWHDDGTEVYTIQWVLVET
jgi:hypothetical protein